MKTTKKLISILLAALLCFGCMTVAFADFGTAGDLTWDYNEETKVLTISGTGAMPYYSYDSRSPWNDYIGEIETVVIEDGVTSIGSYAFHNCTALESIEIPAGVTSIDTKTFEFCTALESVVIGAGVTSIGWDAFASCTALQSIEIPDSVMSIDGQAFLGCTALESVVIGAGVTSIGEYAFHYCTSLESVVISDGVTSIGDGAFSDCTELQTVNYTGSEEAWNEIQMGNDAFTTWSSGDQQYPIFTFNYVDPADQLVLDKEAYEEAVATAIADIDNYRQDGDSVTTAAVADGVIQALGMLAYDETLSLEDNLRALEAAVEAGKELIDAQRASEAQPDEPTPTDSDKPAKTGAPCPVCGATEHEIEWIGILHQVFYALKYLFNNVLFPIFKAIRK